MEIVVDKRFLKDVSNSIRINNADAPILKEIDALIETGERIMTTIPKIDALEMIRTIGEIKKQVEGMDTAFIQWIMRVGESRNILNNALIEFNSILGTMRELEKDIPHFHKQPGTFRIMERHVMEMISVLKSINAALSYIEEPKSEDDEIIADDEEV